MTNLRKLKLFCCFVWTLFLFGAIFCKTFLSVDVLANGGAKPNEKPSVDSIEKFDRAIQQRFLTEPGFGITRIAPPNPHLNNFYPKEGDEKTSVENFEKDGWKTALYLYGRRIEKQSNEKSGKAKFYISNRTFNPMAITKNVKAEKLTKPAYLLDEVDNAFQRFQSADTYEFDARKWAYVAKPVRARQSCLKCHTDYIMISPIGEKPYKYRKRRVGDTIGVLIYGFEKGK